VITYVYDFLRNQGNKSRSLAMPRAMGKFRIKSKKHDGRNSQPTRPARLHHVVLSLVDGQLVQSTFCAIEDRGRLRVAIVLRQAEQWRFLDWAGVRLRPPLAADLPKLTKAELLPHRDLQAWFAMTLEQQDAQLAAAA
jgi:hypothetical protein